MFSGSIPALVTPFRDGALDERAFRRLVDWQIENGSAALVPCGTTGENSTLSNAEHHRVIEVCIEQAAGRVPVIAGCGSNDTMNALLHMTFSKKSGAAAALLVAPYYNRPSQEGLLAHFSYLAEHSDLPIVLYNVPGRTVTDLQPETVCELARRFPERFVGIKDASGDLSRVTDHRMGIGKHFCQLSGDDELALPFNAAGGGGLHFGDRQCRAQAVRRFPGRLRRQRPRACARIERPALSAALCDVRGCLARPLQVCAEQSAGLDRRTNCGCRWCRAASAARNAVDAALVHAGLVPA